jgi:hypothetical protein
MYESIGYVFLDDVFSLQRGEFRLKLDPRLTWPEWGTGSS